MKLRGLRVFLAAGVVILIFMVRAGWLNRYPAGLWLDEAAHGLDASYMLKNKTILLFFPGNAGREPLYTWSVALNLLFLEADKKALRLPAAIIGFSTVVLIYILVRSLYNEPYLAAISAIIAGFSRWHIHYSRMAFRGILVPFFEVLTLLFLVKAIKTRKMIYTILCGISLGAGFYSYIPYRIFPLYIFLILFLLLIKEKNNRFLIIKYAITGLIVAFLVFLPILIYSLKNLEIMMGRVEWTSLKNQPGSFSENLRENFFNYMKMFTFAGDRLLRHNIPGKPMLNSLLSPFFFAGIVLCLLRARQIEFITIPIFLFLTLIPGIVAVWAPHALRVLGSFPPAIFLCAISLSYLIKKWGRKGILLVGFVLFFVSYLEIEDYFLKWDKLVHLCPPERDSLDGMNLIEEEIAMEILKEARNSPEQVFVLAPSLYLHATIQYLLLNKVKLHLASSTLEPEFLDISATTLIFLSRIHRNMWWLRESPIKNYWWWWRNHLSLTDSVIYSAIGYCYPPRTNFTRESEQFLFTKLCNNYPDIQIIEKGKFDILKIPLKSKGQDKGGNYE